MSDRSGALVARIYEAAREPARWDAVTDELARSFDAPTAVFGVMTARNGTLDHLKRLGSCGIPREAFFEWGSRNPWYSQAVRQNVGEVVRIESVLPADTMPRDFLEYIVVPYSLQHGLGVAVLNAHGIYAGYSVYRDTAFDAEEEARFGALGRAFRDAALFDEYVRGAVEWLELSGRAAILVGDDGTVCFASVAAERLLAATPTIAIRNRRLRARDPADQRLLEKLFHRVGRGLGGPASLVIGGEDALGITAVTTRGPLAVAGAPALASVALFLSDPREKTRAATVFIRDSFGLTPAEALVLEAVLSGSGLPTVSAALGIAPTTAKTHLQHIFQKTGTRHQAELVRLAFGASPSP